MNGMRVPIRKPGKYTHLKPDPHLTGEKLGELKNELERLQTVSQPRAITEVRRLAEMGDFSENAAYAIAKGRLRGINQRILELQDHLKRAVIIRPNKHTETVQLGSSVTVAINGRQQTFVILGSSETDPNAGVISHRSPVGAALMGRRAGDQVQFQLANKKRVTCTIIRIA